MKTFVKFALFIFSFSSFAGEAIVTTLEAPLMSEPDMTSQVRQLVRKGDKVYIHNKHFQNSPLEVSYDASAEQSFLLINENSNGEGFYQTNDRNGRTAYISSRYVKLITDDIREFSQNITPYSPDPNDYRLEEPLPENYPLIDKEKYRAIFSFSMGPDIKNNYNYDGVFSKEDFSNQYGFDIRYSRKAGWDKENRFYFGGMLRGWTAQSKFTLYDDGTEISEVKSQLGIGPFLSYDPWRSRSVAITFTGGALLNYDRNFLSQKLGSLEEERLFSAFTITPFVSTYAQFNTNVPDMKFIMGINTQFNLPHDLQSSSEPEFTSAWNTYGSAEDRISVPFSFQWSAFIGIQSAY